MVRIRVPRKYGVQREIELERSRQNADFNRRLKNAEDSMKAIYPEEYKKIRSRYFGNGNNLGLIGSQYNYIHDMITRRSDDQMKNYYNELNDYFIKQTGTQPGYMLPDVDVNGEYEPHGKIRDLTVVTPNSDYLNTVSANNAKQSVYNSDAGRFNTGYEERLRDENPTAYDTWERAQNSPIVTAMEFSPLFPVVAGVKAVAAADAPQASASDVAINAAFASLPAVTKIPKAIKSVNGILDRTAEAMVRQGDDLANNYRAWNKRGMIDYITRGGMYPELAYKSGRYSGESFDVLPHKNDVVDAFFGKGYSLKPSNMEMEPHLKQYISKNYPNKRDKIKIYDLGETHSRFSVPRDVAPEDFNYPNVISIGNHSVDVGGHNVYPIGTEGDNLVSRGWDIWKFKGDDLINKYAYKKRKLAKLAGDFIDSRGTPLVHTWKQKNPIRDNSKFNAIDLDTGEWYTLDDKDISYTLPDEDIKLVDFKSGGIHINPKNEGKFTESANRSGMGVQEYARHILANKENYSPTMVRRANFARNASKWKHDDGGAVPPFKSFDDWYRSITHNATDTSDYNLRRAYDLAPASELEMWRNNPGNHLHTGYWNGDEYEFMKKRNHPTLKNELDWYNSKDGAKFRMRYALDTTGDTYRYVPRYGLIFKNGGYTIGDRNRGNERQRNEFEQMSSSRKAASPENEEVVNVDNSHEWKRIHWGEYDKAPTGNKLYGDVYTINRPEIYDTGKKRVELKRRIREEFPDAKIKYDNGSISFRVPKDNDEFNDFVIKDDYTPTPIYNRPEFNVRLRKYYELPSIKQNGVMYYKPQDVEVKKEYLPMAQANLYKRNGDWGDIGFFGSQYITDDNKQFKFDDNFDYNKYFHEVPYEQMQPGDLIFHDLYSHDGKLLYKGKQPKSIKMEDRSWDDEGSAFESLVPQYEIVTDYEEHPTSHIRVYRPNNEKIYDDSAYQRVKKLNDEIKRENDYVRGIYTDIKFPSDKELGYKRNGGVLYSTYREQINRIMQPRYKVKIIEP